MFWSLTLVTGGPMKKPLKGILVIFFLLNFTVSNMILQLWL
jgi:hypothetical protein